MIKTLGTTTNFTLTYDDSVADAQRRAQAIRTSCEGDWTRMTDLFRVSTGFGSSNRVTVEVSSGSFANNNFYRDDGSMKIQMTPFSGAADQAEADDACRALFVAEASELLMSYAGRTAATWNPGGSDGEGLSRMLAGSFYPEAYYSSALLGGPFVNSWLSSGRTNWVDTRESTDRDGDSFGCSLLFLYWMRDQLNLDFADIVSATGTTLGARYTAVTGQTNGWQAFSGLLKRFFPPGNTYTLATDDPFPLLDGSQRHVWLNSSEKPRHPQVATGRTGTSTLSPGGACKAKDYEWEYYDDDQELTFTATVYGFAQPVFSWKINGVPLTTSGASINGNANVAIDDPNDPSKPTHAVKSVQLWAGDGGDTSDFHGPSHALVVDNYSYEGHISVPVEVSVTEAAASKDSLVATSIGVLDAEYVVYEASYYADQKRCRDLMRIRLSDLVEYKHINILLTLPDPGPPDLAQQARLLEQTQRELRELATKDPKQARQAAALLAARMGVDSTWMLPAGVREGAPAVAAGREATKNKVATPRAAKR